MKIKELLTINLDEEIRTVVDLDANSSSAESQEAYEKTLKEDLDNFVLTNSLAKHLHEFGSLAKTCVYPKIKDSL
jgi:3-isopropylmalate dehydratase small subunit